MSKDKPDNIDKAITSSVPDLPRLTVTLMPDGGMDIDIHNFPTVSLFGLVKILELSAEQQFAMEQMRKAQNAPQIPPRGIYLPGH